MMETKTILGLVGAFIGGAAVGGLITYKVLDKKLSDKYEAFANEQIDSVKEKFTVPRPEVKKFIDDQKSATLASKAANKPSITEYKKKVSQYTNYSNVEYDKEDTVRFELKTKAKPVVIDPDSYGYEGDDDEFRGYEQISLTYYADGILADEDDTILNLDEVIGEDAVNHIGDYEDDAVHVRNDARKVYYEVLVDERSYEKATGKTPHQNKDEED
jgi:hypothetical protein